MKFLLKPFVNEKKLKILRLKYGNLKRANLLNTIPIKELKKIPKIWIINQFANTPDMPGHTRQYETAIGLSKKEWKVSVFSSDFNLTKRKYLKLKKYKLTLINLLH